MTLAQAKVDIPLRVRLPSQLVDRIDHVAHHNHITRSAMVRVLLYRALEDPPNPPREPSTQPEGE